ncbi:hypothetical protein LZC95_07970 [Pendulispora brunnea]|uniref:Uncharacterized protein n=1 Tax=Pendulispora brunnea TaxID=2905690 RepID=A0ABZ2KK78_9BACT
MTAPFFQSPDRSRAHVLFVYRNFAAIENPNCQSHVGLGVNVLHSIRVLRRHGVDAYGRGVWTVEHVRAALAAYPQTTHLVCEAPWIEAPDVARLISEYPDVHFLIRSHSQIGFLQVEAGAIHTIRDLMLLQDGALNLSVASNSKRLKHYLERTYNGGCVFLPNLYDIERVHRKRDLSHTRGLVRIGSFGAIRILKNHSSAAAAAMLIAKSRGVDLEFHISVNREEGGNGVVDALRAMFKDVPWARLIESPWQDWAKFRRLVAYMDLNLQASLTETFNIVSADSTAEGVPCVVTPMIEWAPRYWQVDPDDIEQMARVGNQLLSSIDGAEDGLEALTCYVRDAVRRWLAYLDGAPSAFKIDV